MGLPPVGSVVLINFPYADLKNYKKRPAVVMAPSSLDTVILCQITSKTLPETPSIRISTSDFSEGGLPVVSYVRPDKLFTVDQALLSNQIGKLRPEKIKEILAHIQSIFT